MEYIQSKQFYQAFKEQIFLMFYQLLWRIEKLRRLSQVT